MYSGETGQTDGQRGYRALSYSRPSSIRILHKVSGKGNCLYRQRSLSESDADSKEYGETGQKPTVSFVVANDSDVDSTGNVNIKPNIDEKAINLHSSVGINELSGKGNCLNHQRSLSELDADSKEHVEARHKPVVSFVVENDSDRDSTDYVCMKPKIHQKAITLRYNRPSSLRINELSGKRNCFNRQRSLSESDADSKEYGEAGHNPKISFVVENESDVKSTDYVCMRPNIHKKAIKLPSWPSPVRKIELSGEGNSLYHQRRLSESDADSKEHVEVRHKPKVSFVVANDSDRGSSDYVNIKPNIDEKAINLPSSVGINELSGKRNCFYRQRSLSESDADSKEYGEAGHKPKISFVVENESDGGSTDYVCMKPNIHKKAMQLPSWPSPIKTNEPSVERNCYYRQRSLSESYADSNEHVEVGHKPKVSFLVTNDSDGGSTDYVCMKPNIHQKAIKFPSWPSSVRPNELSGKRKCYNRQRSLSESDAVATDHVEAGHKPKESPEVENDSDDDSTDYMCMKPSIHKKAIKLPSWPSSISTNELSVERNCYYRQRSLSESDADSKEQVEAGHKPKISFVVENESDVKSTDYVCLKPSIHRTAMELPSWPSSVRKNELSGKGNSLYHQRILSASDADSKEYGVKNRHCLERDLLVAIPPQQKVDDLPIKTNVENKAESIDFSNIVSDAPNARQSVTNRYNMKPSEKRIYIPNLHSKLIKFLIDSPDRRRYLIEDMARKGFDIIWPQTEEGIIFLEPSGSTDSCSRLSDGSSGDEIATMFCSRLRNYFILDDSICAADEIYGDLRALLAVAPLVTNCTIYIESMTWIIVGDKESVENCKCQMITLIQFLEMRLKASGITTITKTMFLTKYADLILESKLYERSHLETLKVDFDEKYEYIKVKGEKLAVESVMQELQSFLQAAKGSVYKGSPLILRLLNNTKVKANLKKLLRNRGLVSAWRIVEDICIVYGTSLEDVRSVKKIFIRRLVSETIKLSDGQNELMYSEKGKQEIAYMTNRYDGFLEIEISGHFMEIACTFEIQTEVRNILREFLNRHEVIKTIHEVDNGLFKLLQHYHDDKLAIMQQRCMKIMLVEVSPFEENSKCGFLLTGRREFCIEAARELEKVLATVTGFELTIKRVEFISFLRSEKGRGQIATFESENQCIVQFPNGSPISQNKVCVCQYDNKELIVLNDDISAVTKGLAYIPFQTSDKQTMSPADEEMSRQIDCTISPDKKHVNKYNFFASMPDTEPFGHEASDAVKTSIGLCLRETTKREMSCVAFSISNPTGKSYPADYAKILVQTVKEFLESKTCSTELQRVVFCAKDELHTNAFIQVLECAFGQKTVRVSASNISEMMESVCPPRITKPTVTTEETTYRLSSSELMVNVEILQGDITKETTDAIVNSVHWNLDLSATVLGKALLEAGGSDIQTELRTKQNLPVIRHEGIEGIVVTGPGKLSCRNIFHVLLQGSVNGWETVISSCLQLAETRGVASLSFPALGTGRNGIKPHGFAKAILKCIRKFSTTSPKSLHDVRIVIYDEAMFYTVLETANAFRGRKRRNTPKAKIYDVLKSPRQVEDEVRLQVYTAVDNVDKVKRNLEELCKKEATEG